ncbi:MAG TPA: glycosyltransferase family 2 protein [Streptosporangiaceae bacterium]|nr:glycosyltransferase family 2 protein [Streptosporangiaceae bacterium]
MPARGDLAVIIPARNESDRISATVKAAAAIPGVDLVIVVDDGSADGTGAQAAHAGAVVSRHAVNRGKAAAMETGAEAVRVIESRQAGEAADGVSLAPRHLLFLDADLAGTARNAASLAEPVLAGEADMTIAVFASREKRGGHGFVLRLAGTGIERLTGWRPAEPLNGQRCLTRAAFEAARPLAGGWGAEVGLTIDLLRQGMRIAEVRVPLAHRATGKDLQAQLHRAHQFADVARALAARQPLRQPKMGHQESSARPAGEADVA